MVRRRGKFRPTPTSPTYPRAAVNSTLSETLLEIARADNVVWENSQTALLDLGEHRALSDGGAGLDRKSGDDTVLVRGDRVLHLHRLEHHHQVAHGNLLAFLDGDLDDGALHRGG